MLKIKSAKKFSSKIQVKEYHLDTFGHMNNATYLQILEDARWDIINENGFGIEDIQKQGIGPVILEIQIKFIKELKLREFITIETQCQFVSDKINHLTHEILNEDGKVCCEVKIILGVFNLETRKLIKLPPQWFQAIGVEVENI